MLKGTVIVALILLSSNTIAGRKGPIFEQSDVPAQEYMMKLYAVFNAKNMVQTTIKNSYFNDKFLDLGEEDFKLFNSRIKRHTPNLDFSLAFQNHKMGFEDKEKQNDKHGYCIGVTTVLRKMNLLAFYDPSNSYTANVPDKATDPEKWLLFYQEQIDRIMSNKPAIIPYFSNLQEFSGTPGIKEYLVKNVINEWGIKNATLYGGVIQMLYGVKRKLTKRELKKLYYDLRERLDLGYPPRVFLARKNYDKKVFGPQYIHIMQVFDLTPRAEDGTYKIGVWHINVPWDKATYYIDVRADGTAWMEFRDLGELDIVPQDDAEIAEMIVNLKPFCKKHPGLCY